MIFRSSALSGTFLAFTVFGSITWALPSYRRLWEKKYGAATSCSLCHSKGGGSQLNSYGEDFQRFGMTPGAFVTIEKRDSDKDKFDNLSEINAKSNPGDFASTPSKPTDWLSRIEESMLPLPELRKLFPDRTKFSTLEGTLFPDQQKSIEAALSGKLTEADLVPTFYFAINDEGGKPVRTGVAIFSSVSQAKALIVGVGVDLTGKIKNVILVKNKVDKAIGKPEFLNQFQGKTLESGLQVGKEIQPATTAFMAESTLVANEVKKSLLIIQAVFNKTKK